jgi:hypothetical protein
VGQCKTFAGYTFTPQEGGRAFLPHRRRPKQPSGTTGSANDLVNARPRNSARVGGQSIRLFREACWSELGAAVLRYGCRRRRKWLQAHAPLARSGRSAVKTATALRVSVADRTCSPARPPLGWLQSEHSDRTNGCESAYDPGPPAQWLCERPGYCVKPVRDHPRSPLQQLHCPN